VEKTREAGYRRIERNAFPVEGLPNARVKAKHVPLITLIGGLTGGLGGFSFSIGIGTHIR